eukprot:CAMPEP_0197439328 /NCGR_PEP_ID=MMETSP1175-20131217/6096_1 /TAXON_ID=1003142 /ORGANISM="Triceratium dubium, Strain CCMP147" /LENGTH=104 /DNA_ID=CAMNT_0042969223 /DNA_START=165 /DNA_END=479 /DNA_ORIENTATION=+
MSESCRQPQPLHPGQVRLTAPPPMPMPPKPRMPPPPPVSIRTFSTVPRPSQPLHGEQKKHFSPSGASCGMSESCRHPQPLHPGQVSSTPIPPPPPPRIRLRSSS